MPADADPKVTDFYKTLAHKHGLSAKQAAGLYGEWNEFVTGLGQQSEAEMQATSEREVLDVKKEWGIRHSSRTLMPAVGLLRHSAPRSGEAGRNGSQARHR